MTNITFGTWAIYLNSPSQSFHICISTSLKPANLNGYKTANHYWAFDVSHENNIVNDLIGRKSCTMMDGAHIFMSVKRKMVCSMVENGGYLNFGSWAGECITDPDLCTNGFTISMWLRINANNINYNSEYQYIISSGAEGETMRGIVFLLKVGKLINFWYFLVWYGVLWYGVV